MLADCMKHLCELFATTELQCTTDSENFPQANAVEARPKTFYSCALPYNCAS